MPSNPEHSGIAPNGQRLSPTWSVVAQSLYPISHYAQGVKAPEDVTPLTFLGIMKHVESEIERRLLRTFLWLEVGTPDMHVGAQVNLDCFRCDFVARLGSGPIVVVEADGAEFHAKFGQQATRDRYRDRYMISRGFLLARFTGAEIHADEIRCARQIGSMLRGEVID